MLIWLWAFAMGAAVVTDTPVSPIFFTGSVVFLLWCVRSEEAAEPVEHHLRRVKLTMLCDRNRYKGRHALWSARKLGHVHGPAYHWSVCPDWYGPPVNWQIFLRMARGGNVTTNQAA